MILSLVRLAALLLCLAFASPALAHGPTFRVGHAGVRPAQLVIAAGDTVHFKNSNASGTPVTLVFEQVPEGAAPEGGEPLRSPVLDRANDWHHTFDVPGQYVFALEGAGSKRGTLIVAPK